MISLLISRVAAEVQIRLPRLPVRSGPSGRQLIPMMAPAASKATTHQPKSLQGMQTARQLFEP
jgi:hypothetical protein